MLSMEQEEMTLEKIFLALTEDPAREAAATDADASADDGNQSEQEEDEQA